MSNYDAPKAAALRVPLDKVHAQIERLERLAIDISGQVINGWGNECLSATETMAEMSYDLSRLLAELDALRAERDEALALIKIAIGHVVFSVQHAVPDFWDRIHALLKANSPQAGVDTGDQL
jgi:hypothetical protein